MFGRETAWGVGVVLYALECAWRYGLVLAVLGAVLLLVLAAVRGGRLRRLGGPVCIPLFLALAWFLRDRQHLLGDARLWIDGTSLFGLRIPVYHEPFITKLFGLSGELLGGLMAVEDLLALLTILAGILSAAALARLIRETLPPGDEGRGAAAGLASGLIFLQPMSFVFFGHVETYPVFGAILAFLLLSVSRDVRAGRLGLTTGLLFGLLCLGHIMGVLIAPPLAVLWHRLRQRAGEAAPSPVIGSGPGALGADSGAQAGRAAASGAIVPALLYLGPYALMAGIVALFPSLRSFSVFAPHKGPLNFSAGYVGGVANAWFTAFVPLGVVLAADLVRGRWGRAGPAVNAGPPQASGTAPPALDGPARSSGGPFTHFLILTLLPYLALPFAVPMVLGAYRDLDLLTPAFITLTFLAAHRGAGQGSAALRRGSGFLALGLPLLAAWLVISICPAGIRAFEDQLKRPDLLQNGRTYGYETLGFYFRDHGDLDRGIRMLRAGLEVDPGSQRLRGPIGLFLLARGDTAEARSSLEKAAAMPKGARFRAPLAEIYDRQGQPERAVALLTRDRQAAIADEAQSAALAAAYLHLEMPESTFAVCRARLDLAPGDPVTWHNLAAACIRMDRLEEAAAALRRAAELDPDSPEYRRRLGLVEEAIRAR